MLDSRESTSPLTLYQLLKLIELMHWAADCRYISLRLAKSDACNTRYPFHQRDLCWPPPSSNEAAFTVPPQRSINYRWTRFWRLFLADLCAVWKCETQINRILNNKISAKKQRQIDANRIGVWWLAQISFETVYGLSVVECVRLFFRSARISCSFGVRYLADKDLR